MNLLKSLSSLAIAASAAVAIAGTAQADFTSPNAREIVEKVRKCVISVQNVSIDSPVAAGNAGGGSGFVFSVDYDKGVAYAMTNHHVSGSAFVNLVHFWDGATYKAELVGYEPGIDVAILRILDIPDERDLSTKEKSIVPCVLGDSDKVQIGDYTVAMGSPGVREGVGVDRDDPLSGLLVKQTSTDGAVLGRDTPIEFGISIWAQNQGDLGYQYGTNFDYAFRMVTPINPGNSGGPLFNSKGEVIGINFYGGTFSLLQNSNHAIPINLAKDFATQLLSTGKFVKPWLGMDIIMPPNLISPPLPGDEDKYIEFKERRPRDIVEVYNVRRDSPAERAGLLKGDQIVAVDSIEFSDPEAVRVYIFKQAVGKKIALTVRRNGKKLAQPIYVEVGVKRKFDAEFSV
jgi:S1-C subfamily serine protease